LNQNEGRSAATATTGEYSHRTDIRVLIQNGTEILQLGHHGLERRAPVDPEETHQLTGILLRKQALGYHGVEIHIQANSGKQGEQHQTMMLERPIQRATVTMPTDTAYPAQKAADRISGFMLLRPGAQQTGSHHG